MSMYFFQCNYDSSGYCAVKLLGGPIVFACFPVMYLASCTQIVEDTPLPVLQFRADTSTQASLLQSPLVPKAVTVQAPRLLKQEFLPSETKSEMHGQWLMRCLPCTVVSCQAVCVYHTIWILLNFNLLKARAALSSFAATSLAWSLWLIPCLSMIHS